MLVTNNLPTSQLMVQPDTATFGFRNEDPTKGFSVPQGDWITNEGRTENRDVRFGELGEIVKRRAASQTRTARNNGDIGANENIIPLVVYYDAVGRDEFGPSFDGRDFSAGAAETTAEYRKNIAAFLDGLGNNTPFEVVIEPDSLAGATVANARIIEDGNGGVRLSDPKEIEIIRTMAEERGENPDAAVRKEAIRTRDVRDSLIESIGIAVEEFSKNKNAVIYIDAGNNQFTPSNDEKGRFTFLAEKLVEFGIATDKIAGFSTNASNFEGFGVEREYGSALREKIKEISGETDDTKIRQMIDTGRNGTFVDLTGDGGPVFNRPEATFGRLPGDIANDNLTSARWIKNPTESDGDNVIDGKKFLDGQLGDEFKAPSAGTFFEAYILQLYLNAPETLADVPQSDRNRGFIPSTREQLREFLPAELIDSVLPRPGFEATAGAFTGNSKPGSPNTITIKDPALNGK